MFNKKITTISFEGSEIRFLSLSGEKVTAWKTVSVTEDAMSQGLIHTPKTIGPIVQTTLKELKASRRNVISAVTGSRSVHRIMRIPSIPDKLLEETIRRKARQEFAIPIEDTDLSWQIISRAEDQITLYVLAVPKNLIDQVVKSLQGAKIKPKLMDIKPLALTRIASQATALIVNMEDYAMGVTVLVNYVPILVRTIPLERGDLTGEAKIDLLSQELARTAKYYNESHKADRLPESTPVFVSGALFSTGSVESRLGEGKTLEERLQSRTPYPLKPPATELVLPDKFPLQRYAVNVGLAAKNIK
ncbi:MAG: pilus assembly protein PilM [Anaerolineales bacterium]